MSMDKTIASVVKQLFDLDVEIVLTRPDAQFGDYATNVALTIAKSVGKAPREVAEQIAIELRNDEMLQDVTVAGPGFINLKLTDEASLAITRREPRPIRAGQTIVIETNNPNPFKPMHIGHAYNAILADTMANLLAVSGASTKRVSYHGDVGAHVGRSMWALLKYCDGDFSKLEEVAEDERNEFMGKMYAEGARIAKEDEKAKAEIAELAKQSFDRGAGLYREVYDTVFDWSFREIDKMIKRLGNIQIERRYFESEADPIGVQTVRDNVPVVFQESDGALVFEGSKYGAFDNAFVGSNGLGLYAARDLGLIQLKAGDYPAMDQSIVVTGGEQAAYFKGVIAAAELALPELKGKLVNYPTGLVKLSTGKMSSRTGDVVTIDWLFDEFAKAIEARGGVADESIVAGALRYQFLRVKTGGDVIFDINSAVSLTGNTGSYLQYTHARARRILEKVAEVTPLTELYDEDKMLVRKLSEYHEIVDLATRELAPHYICNYLFDLAQEFNRYYEKNQVAGHELEGHRAGLVYMYADTLRAGLTILGIHAPDKM